MKKVYVLMIMLAAFFPVNAQNLVDGEKLDNIKIGKSTIDDVIANYGSDYKLKKNTDYSNALVYEKLGLIFYSCQGDPDREIFVIVMQSPFNVQTSKGIVLGKSTFRELFDIYGEWNETSAGFEYKEAGLYFDTKSQVYDNFESDNTNFAQAGKTTNQTNASVGDFSELKNNSSVSSDDLIARTDSSYNVSSDESMRNDRSDNYLINQNRVNTGNVGSFSNSGKDSAEGKKTKFEIELWENKIVNKIELLEKGRLRQCHTDFRTKN